MLNLKRFCDEDPISEAVEKKDKDEVRQIKIKFCAAELMFGLV